MQHTEQPPYQRKVNWVDFADSFATLVVGLILYFAVDEKLGILAVVIGGLIVINRFVTQNKLETTVHTLETSLNERLLPLDRIENYIDISQESRISDIDRLLKSYTSINEKEFRSVKDSVLADASEKLYKLATQKESDELSQSEYYRWLLPMLDGVSSAERLRAVSIMNDLEWDDSPQEQQFFQKHLDAAKRGVIIERLFIMDEAMYQAALSNDAVRSHTEEVNNGLKGYIVDKVTLGKTEPALLKQAAYGFIIIGERVALIDNFSSAGEVRGHVTMDSAHISKLIAIFERLQTYARPFTQHLLPENQPKQLPSK